MKREIITRLSIKFKGTIETPPLNNRESFRQSVIDTVTNVLKFQQVSLEYIGYLPDHKGFQRMNTDHTVYEDCVIVSLNLATTQYNLDEKREESLISDLVRVFEQRTHKHLQVDSTVVNAEANQCMIEMTSDWKYYLKHA